MYQLIIMASQECNPGYSSIIPYSDHSLCSKFILDMYVIPRDNSSFRNIQERRSSTSLFGNMEERRSNTVSKKKIKIIPVETLPPIILYQTLDINCVSCGVTNCGGSKKSQPGVRPLCQNHFKYFDKPRGWPHPGDVL
ncbi:hypothetical protein Plhal304r1_c089g0170851 [Plasmopara halstedii]